jgi:hypothetical protein
VALKGLAGKSLLEHGNIIPSQSEIGGFTNVVDMGKELMAAYRKDPEKYKMNAEVFETYANALNVGRAALNNSVSERPPITSAELVSLTPDKRLDAWGHPFCVMVVDSRIAVISGGFRADTRIPCEDSGISKREIRSSQRHFCETPSGELVSVVDSNYSKRALPSPLPKP